MRNVICCELILNDNIYENIFRMDFSWNGPAPRAGQFFMVKPKRSGVFLGRPMSIAGWQPGSVTFLSARRGKGTQELGDMRIGEEAELIGPQGNAWKDMLPEAGNGGEAVALVGGGIGIAPLIALLCEDSTGKFDLYAGFRKGFGNMDEQCALLGPAVFQARKIFIATEDGRTGSKGRIPDFLEPEKYAAICACGPEPMMKTVAALCRSPKAAGVPCFVSLERRMACGIGACLGCTVGTASGNRRCCAEGPIFRADEVFFDD